MNPFDVFPRRNLPPESESWGREVERRIVEAENMALGSTQDVSSQNRTSASLLSSLALEVERVDRMVRSIPKPVQRVAQFENFAIPSTSWVTIGSLTITPPSGSTAGVINVNATGQLKSPVTGQLVGTRIRLVRGGDASPAIPGDWSVPDGVYRSSFSLAYGWSVSGSDDPITISLQVSPESASMWPGGTGSYAVMTGFGTFTQT